MTDKQKIKVLQKCFEDIAWMAVRYAHGRHTYAPSMVRMAIKEYQHIVPDFNLKPDITIDPPTENELGGFSLRQDYLHDLFDKDTTP